MTLQLPQSLKKIKSELTTTVKVYLRDAKNPNQATWMNNWLKSERIV